MNERKLNSQMDRYVEEDRCDELSCYRRNLLYRGRVHRHICCPSVRNRLIQTQISTSRRNRRYAGGNDSTDWGDTYSNLLRVLLQLIVVEQIDASDADHIQTTDHILSTAAQSARRANSSENCNMAPKGENKLETKPVVRRLADRKPRATSPTRVGSGGASRNYEYSLTIHAFSYVVIVDVHLASQDGCTCGFATLRARPSIWRTSCPMPPRCLVSWDDGRRASDPVEMALYQYLAYW